MMDFIPIEYYYDFHFHFMLAICAITFFHTLILNPYESKALIFNKLIAIYLLLSLLIYIGLRPLNGIFIDMTTYAHIFERYRNGAYEITSDHGFSYFLLFCTKTMSLSLFFFICACIYIIPLYLACKRWFPKYYFFAFLLFTASFSFWSYGVNGMRNGMATSLFILGLSYNGKNNFLMILYFIISISFHTTLMLPFAAFCCTYYVTDTKKYYFFYLLAIALSISMGGIWENIFASIGFGDDRFSQYLTKEASSSKFSSTGFRYDFLIYSMAPIILSGYYKFVNNYQNVIYDRLLHTYIIANGFWVMIIRANFSNRFAYLSWFIMAVVVIYPLLDKNIWTNQFRKTGYVVLIYYAFTYGMFIYYAFK